MSPSPFISLAASHFGRIACIRACNASSFIKPSRCNLPARGNSQLQYASIHSVLRLATRSFTTSRLLGQVASPSGQTQFHAAEEAPSRNLVGSAEEPDSLHMICTIFDSDGAKKNINQKVDKAELCTSHGLQPRDLRKIDSAIPNSRATILARPSCILVNIGQSRVMIKSDQVWLVHADLEKGSEKEKAFEKFVDLLQKKLRASNRLAYEHRALDAVLGAASAELDREMQEVRLRVLKVLDDLAETMVPSELQALLLDTRKLSAFHKKAISVQTAIDEVLGQDEDLNMMYLTEPRTNMMGTDHQEIEILLESYSQQVEEIVNEASALEDNVMQTRSVIELLLDTSRNKLIILDLRISILTMGCGAAALVSGLFGMNLTHGLEEDPSAFAYVTSGALVLATVLIAGGLKRLLVVGNVGLGRWPSRVAKLQERRYLQKKRLSGSENALNGIQQ